MAGFERSRERVRERATERELKKEGGGDWKRPREKNEKELRKARNGFGCVKDKESYGLWASRKKGF